MMKAAPRLDPTAILPSLQALSAAQARFCLGVDRFLRVELAVDLRGTHVLAAFSGGADSSCLLLTLRFIAPRLGFSLSAAHLDHRLRPDSAKEADECARFCKKLDIPFFQARLDRPIPDKGVEAASRSARYVFLNSIADKTGADWIALGHTANDLAEDMLMRLIRGTGWPGLAGMDALDPERRIVRPLLLTPKNAIENFLGSLGTGWLTDPSNSERTYFRNRVRLDLLPFFIKENPAFLDTVVGLWRLGRIDADYFGNLLSANKSISQAADRSAAFGRPGQNMGFCGEQGPDDTTFLPRPALTATPKALRLRLYKAMLDSLGQGQALMAGLLAVDDAFLRANGRTTHHFPGKKQAVVDARGIYWLKARDG